MTKTAELWNLNLKRLVCHTKLALGIKMKDILERLEMNILIAVLCQDTIPYESISYKQHNDIPVEEIIILN